MKRFFIYLIRVYQKILSMETGLIPKFLGINRKICVFYPTCSEYAILSIEKKGIFLGIYKSTIRILKCNPWQKPTIDNV